MSADPSDPTRGAAAAEGPAAPDPAAQNAAAWSGAVEAAWITRFGPPAVAARDLAARPAAKLGGLERHLGDLRGRRVVHLLGSNGVKSVALALLGADVTVIDLAEGNAAYARALAAAAGAPLRYVVADVSALPEDERVQQYDLALAELGIAHYFRDLGPFLRTVAALLAPGGRFVLKDFHPVATKLLSFRGSTAKVRKVRVTGDYFDTRLHEEDAPFSKFLPPDAAARAGKVLWRRWTLGEIVTAVAEAGLVIERLDEEPNRSSDVFDAGIPKTFTLVASRR